MHEDGLDDNFRARLAAVTRGAAGLIPLVGGPLGEVLSQITPKQRQDRLVSYIRLLASRLERLEAQDIDRLLSDSERIDLVERGGYAAAASTTADRIGYVATLVMNGLTADETNIVRRKRLLALFEQLDNDEVALLNAYGQSYANSSADHWNNIQRPPPTHLGSGQKEFEAEKLFDLGRQNLLRLGLLEKSSQI